MVKETNNSASYQAKFANYLMAKKYANLSVKSYVSDLNHFLLWVETTGSYSNNINFNSEEISRVFAFRALKQYILDCQQKEELSTVERRKSALSTFLKFAAKERWLSNNVLSQFQGLADGQAAMLKKNQDLLKDFVLSLQIKNQSKNTIRSYTADIAEYLQITN